MTDDSSVCAAVPLDGDLAPLSTVPWIDVRMSRTARALGARRNEVLELARSFGEALCGERYLSHGGAQQLIAVTSFLTTLDDLDVERVVTSLHAPLCEAVRQIAAFRQIDEAALPREVFVGILGLINGLHGPPARMVAT
jgi:hypothetical protein